LVRDSSQTRRSFVVHYSTAAHYKRRSGTMQMKAGGSQPQPIWNETAEIIKSNGARGFQAPLKGIQPDRLPLKSRLRTTARRWWKRLRR
ncbi:MAG TPA: hypothetical protein VLV83_09435, partial [Acidobacteriota bacterium]|nr:hypothetical protein [Acidobacteriota bacterium]